MNYLTTQDKVTTNDIPQRRPIAQQELQTNWQRKGERRVEKETMSFTLLKF
jgi:hypothetical protein